MYKFVNLINSKQFRALVWQLNYKLKTTGIQEKIQLVHILCNVVSEKNPIKNMIVLKTFKSFTKYIFHFSGENQTISSKCRIFEGKNEGINTN